MIPCVEYAVTGMVVVEVLFSLSLTSSQLAHASERTVQLMSTKACSSSLLLPLDNNICYVPHSFGHINTPLPHIGRRSARYPTWRCSLESFSYAICRHTDAMTGFIVDDTDWSDENAVVNYFNIGSGRASESSDDDRRPEPHTPNPISSGLTQRPMATGRNPAANPNHDEPRRRISSPPDTIRGNCFETTGLICGRGRYIEVTHMLVDTGASSSFISPEAVEKARLTVHHCLPPIFTTSNGQVSRYKYTEFPLFLEGVTKTIRAYVDEGPSATSNHVLLGVPVMQQFDMQSNHCYGRRQETRWSISENVTGARRKRIQLRCDPLHGQSTVRVRSLRWGRQRTGIRGETTRQLNARKRLERERERLRRLEAELALQLRPIPEPIEDDDSGNETSDDEDDG